MRGVLRYGDPHVLQIRRQDREDNLIVGQLVASQNKVPFNSQ